MKNDEIVFLEKDDFRLAFKTFYDNPFVITKDELPQF